MIELHYSAPAEVDREAAALKRVEAIGGRLDFREEEKRSIVLTYEFEIWEKAEAAIAELRELDFHVEGPSTYG